MANSSSSTMNVRIKTEDDNSFGMKIGHSDTVYEVKAKISEITGTPISHQTLEFQDRVLENTSYVQSYSIIPNSRLLLRIEDPFRGLPGQPTTAELLVSIPKRSEPFISLPMNLSDTVLQLKTKLLQQNPDLPGLERMGVYRHKKRHELQDAKCLSDYGLSSGSMLDVFIKPTLTLFLTPLTLSPSNSKKKVNIQVLTSCGKRLNFRVYPTDQVGVLREELKKLQSWDKIQLSSDYFFVHNKSVLDETTTFQRNYTEKDDEIEIVHGIVHLLLEKLATSSDVHMPTCWFSPLLSK